MNIPTLDDWLQLEFEITLLFDGAPIDEKDLLAGRIDEVTKMLRAVMTKSQHIVLYGEKGVGKTSLSNIFWKRFNKTTRNFAVARVQAIPSDNLWKRLNKSVGSFVVARVQANPYDDFSSLWIRCLEELQAATAAAGNPETLTIPPEGKKISPSEIRRELQKCSVDFLPLIIIDEYSEIRDEDAKLLTANLIKELYDYAVNTTVLLVGVAENVEELVRHHESLDRTLVLVPLGRMKDKDVKEIIEERASRTIMKFSDDAIWSIIKLSRGLPFFTHTLSKHAALRAIEDRRTLVGMEDVDLAMDRFSKDFERNFRDAYRAAIQSNHANYFQQSLLACALADLDDEGFFTASDVERAYGAIMNMRRDVAHFLKHLRRFSSDEGGNILIRRVGENQQTFRFTDPMMQPYVIIKGIQSGMINEDARRILFHKGARQTEPAQNRMAARPTGA